MMWDEEERFIEFYEKLNNKKKIFYVYFSKGLLYFALESVRRVPKDVNLVIVVSGIDQSEIDIIEKYIGREVLYLKNIYPDMVIWEMLFRNNKYDFGWLDVDCFVFDTSLFKDLSNFSDDVGVNTVWAGRFARYQINEWLGNTFFTFYNKNVMNEIFDKYGFVSPRIARFPYKKLSYLNTEYCVDIGEGQIELLKEKFPSFKENERGYFDTTHLYQIYILLHGMKIGRVRNVDSLHEYYFDGALHLGGCNRIHEYKLDNPRTNSVFKFNMKFSFLLLKKYLPILPDYYRDIYRIFVKTLGDNGIGVDAESLKSSISRYMKRNNINSEMINFEETIIK